MHSREWFVCVLVLWSAPIISADVLCRCDILIARLEYLEEKVQSVQHTMTNMRNEEQSKKFIQAKVDELQRGIKADNDILRLKVEHFRTKLEEMEQKFDAPRDDDNTAQNKPPQETTPRAENIQGNKSDIIDLRVAAAPGSGRDGSQQAIRLASVSLTPGKVYNSSCKRESSRASGRSMIQLGPDVPPFEVYCEQTKQGGGWIVFQKRSNGQLNFYRNWTEYRDGFGDVDGEFWLGLNKVHQLTALRRHELLVEVRDFKGNFGYALYDDFAIGSEEDQYVLRSLGSYRGTAWDAMYYNLGQKFSTADRNNGEPRDVSNCAVDRQGAWWYVFCTKANLNGPYKDTLISLSSMYWYFSPHDRRPLAYSRMMIREV